MDYMLNLTAMVANEGEWGLAVLACSVVGFGWMSRANRNHSRLLEAKRKAEEQQLIDDYKK